MSRLNSRSNIPRRVAPRAVAQHIGVASLGEGLCVCGAGPFPPENLVVSGGTLLDENGTCPYVGDMRVEVTVNSWDANDNSISLISRVNIGGPGSYSFDITGLFPSSWANAEYRLSKYVDPTTTVLAGPSTLPRPAPGDVLELSTIGTAVIASINGTPLFSVTDSSVVATAANEAILTGFIGGNVDLDVVYEDYCP